ncbi:hypothetical protein [Mesoplasma lactucae]|uniref:hypothetical protein n=1 Tax=Mesoplasma lactucae TaxID=138853 RepID=UPI000CA32375|nr:hypothetical protein [Mesoplasma lactucae]ATZ20403.1 hypothetical protein MLACT_v1c05820 [Mesoplasma lactucae ATCC 49193]MCL8216574.1 hypothetical protein [Mesoplasma lactucae ATCC 49193]
MRVIIDKNLSLEAQETYKTNGSIFDVSVGLFFCKNLSIEANNFKEGFKKC